MCLKSNFPSFFWHHKILLAACGPYGRINFNYRTIPLPGCFRLRVHSLLIIRPYAKEKDCTSILNLILPDSGPCMSSWVANAATTTFKNIRFYIFGIVYIISIIFIYDYRVICMLLSRTTIIEIQFTIVCGKAERWNVYDGFWICDLE